MDAESFFRIDFVRYAIPLFLIAIGFEIFLTQKRKKHQYVLKDAITCLSTGVLSETSRVYTLGFTSAAYLFVYQHFSIFKMYELSQELKWVFWVILIFGVDLAYYLFHRAAHRINFGWAGHIAHHSSQEYNLAVALRQSSFQTFFSFLFYLPLAWLGFPPEWTASVFSLNLVYQFWIHTREIKKLPKWVEAIMNTPSHHRVHHGINIEYIDKNYAGIFIIWDKIFGTFEPEVREPLYGITAPLKSFNPIWANFHYYIHLLRSSFRAPSLAQAIGLWLRPPEWNPAWLSPSALPTLRKDNRPGASSRRFVILIFLATVGFSLFWLETQASMSFWFRLSAFLLIIFALDRVNELNIKNQ